MWYTHTSISHLYAGDSNAGRTLAVSPSVATPSVKAALSIGSVPLKAQAQHMTAKPQLDDNRAALAGQIQTLVQIVERVRLEETRRDPPCSVQESGGGCALRYGTRDWRLLTVGLQLLCQDPCHR